MGLIGQIIGSDKVLASADNVVNKISSAVDYAFFTNQEKAELAFKHYELWLKLQEVTANESTAKAITRRILAIIILGSFILPILFAAAIYKIDQTWSAFLMLCADRLSTLSAAVGIFYFGYYGVQQVSSIFKPKENILELEKNNLTRDNYSK